MRTPRIQMGLMYLFSLPKRLCIFLFLLLVPCFASASLEDKIPPNNVRYKTFRYALALMEERGARVLVETGTARGGKCNCEGDGCSTLVFGEWAHQHQAILYSVDIDPQAIARAREDLGDVASAVQLVEGDSGNFLHNFGQPIDFLYLDSYDFDVHNPLPSQCHHLKEIKAAYPWLGKQSIVMIDDCDLPHGGKGRLVLHYLRQRGWKVVADGYQVVLVRQK